jgi:hypothetical protein
MDTNNSGSLIGVIMVIFGTLIWIGIALLARDLAPKDRRDTFFFATLLLFGPFGVVLALIANPCTAPPITVVELAAASSGCWARAPLVPSLRRGCRPVALGHRVCVLALRGEGQTAATTFETVNRPSVNGAELVLAPS